MLSVAVATIDFLIRGYVALPPVLSLSVNRLRHPRAVVAIKRSFTSERCNTGEVLTDTAEEVQLTKGYRKWRRTR